MSDKKRKSFGDKLSSIGSSTTEYFRSQDMFGHPINLQYQGNDTFQTLPGGCMSFMITILIFAYALLKGKDMINKESWALVQQNVLTDYIELNNTIAIKDYTNVTVALQFNKKKPVLTQKEKEAIEKAAAERAKQAELDAENEADEEDNEGDDEEGGNLFGDKDTGPKTAEQEQADYVKDV